MKTTAARVLSKAQIRALAGRGQPLLLIGPCRTARHDAAAAIHRELVGKDLDLDAPHPDLAVLVPPCREDPGAPRSIGIDAVHQFVDKLCRTPYESSVRVGYIEPAAALTLESQNALLRYVEEPTASTRLIFSTRRVEDILPTLLSRCLSVRIAGSGLDPEDIEPLADQYGEDKKKLTRLFEVMDDPDAAERIGESRATRQALELFDALAEGRRPSPASLSAFLEKKPATEWAVLFSQVAFAAACERLRSFETGSPVRGADPAVRFSLLRPSIERARRLLELQGELRYNPQRPLVAQAVMDWLVDQPGRDTETRAVDES